MTVIKNFEKLIKNTKNEINQTARKFTLQILESGLSAADPKNLVKNKIQLKGSNLKIGSLNIDLDECNRIFVVGAGKASGMMSEAIEEILGNRIVDGLVNILNGTVHNFKTRNIKLNEAGHPIPDEGGFKGAKQIIKLLKDVTENDLVISLISGGGSALLSLPDGDITLAEMQSATNSLLKSGATIDEFKDKINKGG